MYSLKKDLLRRLQGKKAEVGMVQIGNIDFEERIQNFEMKNRVIQAEKESLLKKADNATV